MVLEAVPVAVAADTNAPNAFGMSAYCQNDYCRGTAAKAELPWHGTARRHGTRPIKNDEGQSLYALQHHGIGEKGMRHACGFIFTSLHIFLLLMTFWCASLKFPHGPLSPCT
jgi:hypothetical protein